MIERDDQWDLEPYDSAPEKGVFWPILRKFGALVVVSLMVVGGGFGFLDGTKPGAKQPIASKASPRASSGGYEMSIPAGANGHFVVNAFANGRAVKFLVDTGASGILLSEEDAKRVGIQPNSLTYDVGVQTANGAIQVARTTVREIRIGDLTVNNMEVWITRAPMSISLLGMTFLRRLDSYEARADQLILRW